ncbi:hypothetical protein, partial [Fusicatenibacter saccharivorans]|uniref:hypothetical protein n=1 Tax=Fusicatenibacter saccharivorans TaxID=1150298 RepID=UPI003219C4CF
KSQRKINRPQKRSAICQGTRILPFTLLSKISVDISHILGNLITVIFNYQILRKPLKILSL